MQSHILYALDVARERQQRAIDQASIDLGAARARPSIRRSVGRRLVAVGQRIAAEPSLELAQSR